MDAMRDLVVFIIKKEYDEIPPDAIETAKKVVLDCIGAIVAGWRTDVSKKVIALVKHWKGKGEASIYGSGIKAPLPWAVLANTAMGRILDFDDLHEPAVMHGGVAVVPTGLNVSEYMGGVTGKDFLASVVLGIDLACRILRAPLANPLNSGISHSFHGGTFAATAVTCKLLGFDETLFMNAMGIAYSQIAGNTLCVEEGSTNIAIQQGLSSQAGVISALLASKGITGPRNILEARRGGYFYTFHSGTFEKQELTRELGNRYEICQLSTKPFPCCKHIHTSIESIASIIEENGEILPENIERIEVGLNERGYQLVGQPISQKRRPKTSVEAIWSLPYAVATAVVKKNVMLEDFTESALENSAVLGLADKVFPYINERIEKSAKGIISPAAVLVKLKDGSSYNCEKWIVKGHPQNPMDMQEVARKFRYCAAYSRWLRSSFKIEKIISICNRLEDIGDMKELSDLITNNNHSEG